MNNLPGSAGDHRRSCDHSFRFHLFPLPSLDAAQGPSYFRDPAPFTVWSQVLSSITEARRELSRCPSHSGSPSPSLLGTVVSFCPLLSWVPHQNPGNYEKVLQCVLQMRAPWLFGQTHNALTSPALVPLCPGEWYLRFPRKCE